METEIFLLPSVSETSGFKMCSSLTEHGNEGLRRVELKAINRKFRIHYLTILKIRTGGETVLQI